MKKIMILLLATAMLFASIGCSNGNGSDSSSGTGNEVENGGGSGSGTGDKENEAGGSGSGSDVPSTSDCTETVSSLVLSDGEWTVYVSATTDYMTQETILEATVTNGDYEFTSGKGSATVDMEKVFELMVEEMGMPANTFEGFENLPDELKNEFLFEFWGDENTEGYDVSWDGLTANVKATISDEKLAGASELFESEASPDDAVIKTNADRTKYTINFGFEDEYVGSFNVEIKAIKK